MALPALGGARLNPMVCGPLPCCPCKTELRVLGHHDFELPRRRSRRRHGAADRWRHVRVVSGETTDRLIRRGYAVDGHLTHFGSRRRSRGRPCGYAEPGSHERGDRRDGLPNARSARGPLRTAPDRRNLKQVVARARSSYDRLRGGNCRSTDHLVAPARCLD